MITKKHYFQHGSNIFTQITGFRNSYVRAIKNTYYCTPLKLTVTLTILWIKKLKIHHILKRIDSSE